MRKNKNLTLVVASLFLATLWGCGSNMDSGGDQTGPGTAPAAKLGSNTCVICHSAIVAQEWTGSVHDEITNSGIDAGCEGCHGSGQFHKGIGEIPVRDPGVQQCATCHEVTSPGFLTRHLGDDSATSYKTTPNNPVIEGYTNIDDCLGCHATKTPDVTTQWQHNPSPTDINRQWAQSGHAGKIAAAVPDTETVWGHYDWDASFKADGTDAGIDPDKDRVDCQRCHTATGAKNYLSSPTAYDPAKNDFSNLMGWSGTTSGTILTPSTWGVTTSSNQNELLYCWACHSNVGTGALRNPGAITENYAAVNQTASSSNAVADTGTAVPVTYPNINESNVCMACHLGREVGANITAVTSSDGILSFVNSHYLAAGATLFNESGYEYAGQTYDDFGYHKNVGMASPFSSGTAGPCVTCHMSSSEPHAFTAVSTSTACTNCHVGLTDVILEDTKHNFSLALDELRLALKARGIHYWNSHPYFFKVEVTEANKATTAVTANAFTNWNSVAVILGVGLVTDSTGTGWKNVMGAAFNYNLFAHDPGAFAHNRQYALKLIQDSIDFLADGAVNGLGTSTVVADVIADKEFAEATPHAPAVLAAPSATVCNTCHSKVPHFNGTNAQYYQFPEATAFVDAVNSCGQCHAGGSFTANRDILSEYAVSGHAQPNNSTWRGSCGPCHEPGAFINAVSGAGTVTTNATRKVLACNACHTNVATGDIRFELVAAQPIDDLTITNTSNTIVSSLTYTDYGSSVLCVRCHSGRSSNSYAWGDQLTGNQLLFGSHYLVAGPMLENKFGYEFADGGDYDSLGSHKDIDLGASGPCVSCHMGPTANHTWSPVIKDQNGDVVEIVNASVCATCHITTSMTPAKLNADKAAFQANLELLRTALEDNTIYYNPTTASYFQDSAFTTAVTLAYLDSVLTGPLTRLNLIGAMFNYRIMAYSHQDPGAYVHNMPYALKLINDSINILDNGVID